MSLGLSKYRRQFEAEEVDDFLSLPFLRLSCLEVCRTIHKITAHLRQICLCLLSMCIYTFVFMCVLYHNNSVFFIANTFPLFFALCLFIYVGHENILTGGPPHTAACC